MTLELLLKEYETALGSQQWKNVEPFFHNDACVTFANGTFKGKAELRDIFEQNFLSIQDEHYSITNLHWAYQAETSAVALYEFHWEGVIDGERASGGGRGTSVLVNEDNRWWIVSEHLGPFADG
ncbi:nuclear transport factor 2 family protein [Saccharospirillum mangrovi]|uniref:nuclear transport factor 2 family protein n=1 Tax=Saccharospirillum mangrovi TaxID=2161747 RepID=UPI000D39D2DC|nr:nuclear transport factor 2 family protein [Saccharospirillum mangrovi]